jgi:hypothetical protein
MTTNTTKKPTKAKAMFTGTGRFYNGNVFNGTWDDATIMSNDDNSLMILGYRFNGKDGIALIPCNDDGSLVLK